MVVLVLFLSINIAKLQSWMGLVPDNEWLRLDFIDVGQGDAILVTSSTGETLLVDSGGRSQEKRILSFLRDRGIANLDYVIATHPHEDHIGAMAAIIRAFPIDFFYMPDAVNNTAAFSTMISALEESKAVVQEAREGIVLAWKAGKITLLAPFPITSATSLNNSSVVVYIEYGTTSMLLCGDAEEEVESRILTKYPTLRADLIKLGHHGSSTSSTPSFIDHLKPYVAIVTCGTDNDYGLPHRETLQLLESRRIELYRTDTNGSITVYSDGTALYAETEK